MKKKPIKPSQYLRLLLGSPIVMRRNKGAADANGKKCIAWVKVEGALECLDRSRWRLDREHCFPERFVRVVQHPSGDRELQAREIRIIRGRRRSRCRYRR